MLDSFLSFLGHGGFKLLIVAVLFISQFLAARAKIAKKSEAELRGGKPIDELGAPASLFPAKMADAPKTAVPQVPSPLAPPTSIAASPWSNQDAFDGKKS